MRERPQAYQLHKDTYLQDNILRFLFKELQIATGTTDMPAGIWQKEEEDFRERVGEGVPWMAMTSVHKF